MLFSRSNDKKPLWHCIKAKKQDNVNIRKFIKDTRWSKYNRCSWKSKCVESIFQFPTVTEYRCVTYTMETCIRMSHLFLRNVQKQIPLTTIPSHLHQL